MEISTSAEINFLINIFRAQHEGNNVLQASFFFVCNLTVTLRIFQSQNGRQFGSNSIYIWLVVIYEV